MILQILGVVAVLPVALAQLAVCLALDVLRATLEFTLLALHSINAASATLEAAWRRGGERR